MKIIEEKWEKIMKAILLAVDLVSSNAVIPIAYYILKINNPDNFVESRIYIEDRNKIQKWFTASLLKRSFSGTSDNVLRQIREVLNEPSDTFPFDKIVDEFKGKEKTLVFTDDDLDNIMNYEYGKSYTFMALSLLYPTLDFNNKFHQDHIYSRNLFKKAELRKMGIKEDHFEFYLSNRDKLANLQLLPGIPNREKGREDLKKWLSERFENESERRDFMMKHYIPQNHELDFNNFEEFIVKRKEIIKKRLKEILPFATDILEDIRMCVTTTT